MGNRDGPYKNSLLNTLLVHEREYVLNIECFGEGERRARSVVLFFASSYLWW